MFTLDQEVQGQNVRLDGPETNVPRVSEEVKDLESDPRDVSKPGSKKGEILGVLDSEYEEEVQDRRETVL